MRSRLENAAHFCEVVVLKETERVPFATGVACYRVQACPSKEQTRFLLATRQPSVQPVGPWASYARTTSPRDDVEATVMAPLPYIAPAYIIGTPSRVHPRIEAVSG